MDFSLIFLHDRLSRISVLERMQSWLLRHEKIARREQEEIFLPMTQVCSILAVMENSVLLMSWNSSHAKSDARTLNFRSDVTFVQPGKTPNDIRREP